MCLRALTNCLCTFKCHGYCATPTGKRSLALRVPSCYVPACACVLHCEVPLLRRLQKPCTRDGERGGGGLSGRPRPREDGGGAGGGQTGDEEVKKSDGGGRSAAGWENKWRCIVHEGWTSSFFSTPLSSHFTLAFSSCFGQQYSLGSPFPDLVLCFLLVSLSQSCGGRAGAAWRAVPGLFSGNAQRGERGYG